MLFDLQFFAEEATESVANSENTGAGVNPDAGENTERESKSESFEKLIRGEYKEEYGRRVSEIVKNRLKNAKANEEKLSALEKTVEELTKEKGENNSDAEGEADLPQSEDEAVSPELFDEKEMEDIVSQICEAKNIYPNFDLQRELSDPEFCSLISIPGMDLKKAFEIRHHEEIISSAMRYAAAATEKKLAQSTAAGLQRPNEAVQDNASCVIIENNPRGLTKAQRADIKKRVRRGERIIW